MGNVFTFYVLTAAAAFLVALVLMPLCIKTAKVLNIMDVPKTSLKTHSTPVPYLGGVAIYAGFASALVAIRFISHFPTGTLYQLRGLFIGSTIIFLLGLIDDKYVLEYKIKFFIQLIAASVLFRYGISIKIFPDPVFNYLFSTLWILAITNSINIIDVMDGLSSSASCICAVFFFLVSLPTEQIYVNFAAVAMLGALGGFLIFNYPPAQIFMGDAGSLTIGFILASLSMGAEYSGIHPVALLAPVLILAVPLFDLLFVMVHRIRRGLSPFRGSKDHFALRMIKLGFSKRQILLRVSATSVILGTSAWILTAVPLAWAYIIAAAVVIVGIYLASFLSVIDVD